MKNRLQRERRTLQCMLQMYCRTHHRSTSELCVECQELWDYAMQRLDKCPYRGDKPTCARCPIHCYASGMRGRITEVMRYAGPRMMLHHPVLALWHLVDDIRKTKPRRPVSKSAMAIFLAFLFCGFHVQAASTNTSTNAFDRNAAIEENIWRARCLESAKPLLENLYAVLTNPAAKFPDSKIGPTLTTRMLKEKASWDERNKKYTPLRLIPVIDDMKVLGEDKNAGTMTVEASGVLRMVEDVPQAKAMITHEERQMRWKLSVKTTPYSMTLMDFQENKP